MSWTIYESAAPLDEENLASFERAYELALPRLYREFLLHHNGGFVSPNHFDMHGPMSDPPAAQTQASGKIDWFLTVGASDLGALGDYVQQYRISAQRIPPPLIPIGHDGSGSLICIGHEAGDIYFWDAALEYPPGMEPGLQNVFFIADDLVAFLNGLYAP